MQNLRKLKIGFNKIGIILTPIIALYGVLPFFLFSRFSYLETFILFSGLTITVFASWFIISYFIFRFPKWNNFTLFSVSLLLSILLRIIIVSCISLFINVLRPFQLKEATYLITTSIAINIILIFIQKSRLSAKQKAETERYLQELKMEHNEAQLKVLMQQLQPHFLFNSLSVLKSLIGDEPDKAENYVVRLSDFLRYSVQASDIEMVSLEKELNFVKDYIELQKERFEDGFEHKIDIQNDCLPMLLPVMSLQTLVENIFKHNYFTKEKPLYFNIYSDGDWIVVENTKTSIRVIERTQTGLTNLNKRFELLVKKSILIEESENNFVVKIPLLIK